MTEREKDDLFYVCSLIEFVGRKTKNQRRIVVNALGEKGIQKQLYDAQVNHCLTFEQVADEVVDYYKIPSGSFDTIIECEYAIPSVTSIGKLYSRIILDCAKPGEEITELINVFDSFISDGISDFKTGIYYENMSYLECCYQEGHLLD
ncbi:MAG: hypothetical protein K2N51_00440 [Lachnospiraceae bacterium]|nr:hypothetical protein [Lachnospiraceae bacterium]